MSRLLWKKEKKKRHVIFLNTPEYSHYTESVRRRLDEMGKLSWSEINPYDEEHYKEDLRKADLVVTVHSFLVKALEVCRNLRGITTTLTLQDGAIEYRSSKHRFQGIFRFRPLETDYIAVFGDRSKALICAAGNEPDRIYVTGSPRFDNCFHDSKIVPDNHRLLITMSNRPAYGTKNLISFYNLMGAFLDYCDRQKVPYLIRTSRGVRPGGVEDFLKVREHVEYDLERVFSGEFDSGQSLGDDILSCTAVVTTPSTTTIEAMALGRPVCHMLFDPEATYLNSAWAIRTSDDLERIVPELFDPPKLKYELQKLLLKENLIHDGMSTNRICDLIESLTG